MLAKAMSYGLEGLNGYPVDVQADISSGLPLFETVGLPDASVRESKERVRSAIRNSALSFPMQRIVVNLAPASLKKVGARYDLPIAISLLAATGQVLPKSIQDMLFIGELALDGQVRPVLGILPMLISARQHGMRRVMLPAENAAEALLVEDMEIFPVKSLAEAVEHLGGKTVLDPICGRDRAGEADAQPAHQSDFSFIRGQPAAKRAAEIAAAGGHNLLLVGPPGSGKTMLARSMPSILPQMTFEEALEVTKIHSIAGTLDTPAGLVRFRPFRSPHHTCSDVALIGGGRSAQPGEVSLAHYGVLFLDELPEFSRGALEALRQPLEDGRVTISRAQASAEYPARFMLVASMNPCPCGFYGAPEDKCRCTPMQIQRYLNRISGPLLDRIDLQVAVSSVQYETLRGMPEEPSAAVRKRVEDARAVQRERMKAYEGLYFNAQLGDELLKSACALDADADALLARAFEALGMTARAYTRVLKVSRTIADLCASPSIRPEHIAESLQYRDMNRILI